MARPKKQAVLDQTQPDQVANDLLKAKLRQKFHLLKDDPLNYDDKEQLIAHVCTVLSIDRPKMDWILMDL